MNVLLIHCDALHADVFRHNKWPFLKTPHLDRLAAESTVFENTFVQYTTCVPSRASFITGMYPQQLGIFNHGYDVPDSIPTLGHRLNKAGYQSVAFGRTHRQHKGFERFPERNGIQAYGSHNLGFHGDSETITGTFLGKIEDQHDWAVAQEFSDWLDQRDDPRPICAMVGFMAPHTPLYPPVEYSGIYKAEDRVLPALDLAEFDDKPAKQRWIYENRWNIHPPEVQRDMMAKYFDLCTYVDACIGRVIDAVEKNGLLEDTLILFFSDHGEMLGDHGMIGKWFSLYDDALRTPLAIRIPGKANVAQRVQSSIELIDLVPTVLDLLGQSPDGNLPGKSLVPLLKDPKAPHKDAIFSMMETARLIRTEDWKLCVHAGRSSYGKYPRELFNDGEGELYDLKSDPGEVNNLYHDPEYAAIRWDLARRLVEHEIKIQHNLGEATDNHM